MSYSEGDLRLLAKMKRSRDNLEAMKSSLDEMEDTKDAIENFADSSSQAFDTLQEFEERAQELAELEIIDADTLVRIQGAVEAIKPFLPTGEDLVGQFSENHGEASNGCDELENMLDDRDYGADEREEKWGEITDQVTNMADALDELDNIGKAKDDEED